MVDGMLLLLGHRIEEIVARHLHHVLLMLVKVVHGKIHPRLEIVLSTRGGLIFRFDMAHVVVSSRTPTSARVAWRLIHVRLAVNEQVGLLLLLLLVKEVLLLLLYVSHRWQRRARRWTKEAARTWRQVVVGRGTCQRSDLLLMWQRLLLLSWLLLLLLWCHHWRRQWWFERSLASM